ncbi:hypothetical protein [Rheinheimera texasensis]|uniref:hypothetical protein n=1 Tax=Rheinheimera texasensis TaxID=306205 RepID=UPI0004E19054|nr:hypothetical protein [Rheinheimera texasensis]
MKTVNKYQSFAEHLFEDKHVRKHGMMLVKYGFKGAAKRVNPVAIYVDAALSVITAFNAYFDYARAREVTNQLLAQNKQIEAELRSQLEIMQIKFETALAQGDERIKELSDKVKLSELQMKNFVEQIGKQIIIAKAIQTSIRQERESGCNFKQLQDLQRNLDHYLRSCLVILMENVE